MQGMGGIGAAVVSCSRHLGQAVKQTAIIGFAAQTEAQQTV